MAENPFGVAMAKPGDEEDIFDLLMLLHDENGLYTVDPAKVREVIRLGTARQGGMIGIIRGPERIEASIGLVLSQLWYTDAWQLSERWWFVHPEHRRTTHAKNLLRFAKWCSDNMNVPLMVGVVANDRTEAKVRLVGRQIGHVGGFFLHDPRRARQALRGAA